MVCCRSGCDNIMCHDYSEVTGYVCCECKSEMIEYNLVNVQGVKNFMNSEKQNTDYEDEDGFSLSKMFGEEL